MSEVVVCVLVCGFECQCVFVLVCVDIQSYACNLCTCM